MDEREYKAFLEETAQRVAAIVANNRDLAAAEFHSNCEAFDRCEDAYWDAVNRALRKAKGSPELQDSNDGVPPEAGLEWVDYSGSRSSPLCGFWAQALPFEPYAWLKWYYGWEYPDQDIPKGPDETQILMCEYVVLGLIHDRIKDVAKVRRLYTVADEDERDIWKLLHLFGSVVDSIGERKKQRLEDALDNVTADLEGKESGASLDGIENPVACIEVSRIVRVRSDNIARKLRKLQYPVVRPGKENYCNAEHAAVLWPKWNKHWQEKKKSKEI